MMTSKIWPKLTPFLRSLVLLLALTFPVGSVSAQDEGWPPFWFDLIPTYAGDRLTYSINVYRRVEWPLPGLTINIPLPEGTRFVADNIPAGVEAKFDGQAVIFSAPAFDRYLEGASFTVEVIDPRLTVFTTQAQITWQGEQPGGYLAESVSFDTTKPVLNWQPSLDSRLQLGLSATVAGNVITYALYPRAIGRPRMWDLRINIPLPAGTTFVAAEAAPPFTAGFDGQEASFFILELARQTEVEPLILKVSLTDADQLPVVTRAQATWKNSSHDAGAVIPAEETLLTDDLIVQPQLPQQALLDPQNDVPLPNYDITSLVFQANRAMLNIIFNTAGPIGPTGQPVQYTLFIDSDCYSETGEKVKFRGAEYRLRYNHEAGRASVVAWDAAQQDWNWDGPTRLDSQVGEQNVQISLPYQLLGISRQFCWVAQAANNSKEFNLSLPRDWLPNGEHWRLTQQEIALTTPATISERQQ